MEQRLIAFVLAGLLLIAPAVQAQMYHPQGEAPLAAEEPARAPGAALGAATINIVYVPVRLGVSTFGAFLSSITGWLTAGNYRAADDVWSILRGSPYVTPAMLTGQEPFRFGPWETGH